MPQNRRTGRDVGDRSVRGARLLRIALGSAVAVFIVCADHSAARAGDNDVQNESFTDKFLHSLGLRSPNDTDYEINYSERSPLVVPPNRNLPAPVSTNAPPAPNWPVDPEVKAHQASKDKDKPAPQPFDSVIHEERALTPAELGVGRPVAAPGTGEQSTPSELGEKKSNWLSFEWTKKEEYGTFTGEPPRVSLTDPPPGYQTPSPDQPYGIAPEHKTVKPSTLEQRVEPVH